MYSRARSRIAGAAFLLPALVLIVFLTIFPIFYNIYLSLHRTKIRVGVIEYIYVGLRNFQRIFSDRLFAVALLNTLYFMVAASAIEVALGLGMALVLRSRFRGRDTVVGVMLIPMMLPTIVVTAFWKTLLHAEYGAINSILASLGLSPVNWLGDPLVAMPSIILVDVWQYTPFVFLLIYAGFHTVPREVVEAAMVDGAGPLQLLFSIELQYVKPHILVAMLLRLIDTFRLFDKVYALTGGGPGLATESLTLMVYRQAFSYMRFGYGAALALVMLAIISVVIAIYLKISGGGGLE